MHYHMDTKAIVKGSLATVSMGLLITGATMLGARDLFGLVLIGTGVGLNFYKEYFNKKTK